MLETLLLNPIAFNLGPITVHWYGVILGLAALAGLALVVREGKRFGISPDFFMDLLLFGVPSAVIVARIYFVAFKWEDYKGDLLSVFYIWEGGIAIYGALIGAFACGIIYSRYKGYSFLRIADICAPGLIIGQLIGRWGNFVNQEAYGGPVQESFLRNDLHLPSWIVNQMNVEGVFHHPTFLYESLWNVVGLAILLVLRRQKFLIAGELLGFYFMWYALGRFYIEGLRTDSLAFSGPSWLASFMNGLWSPMKSLGFQAGYLNGLEGNVRISQLISVALLLITLIIIVVRRVTGSSNIKYLDPIVSTKASKIKDEPQGAA
ncbi:prolipoprotein diacylglyceryl transferase [Paenibacillus curdlanolyticus YK9]|uniref:Phosphatidylglycerol--prolipoprotein diacylglyceryl transferase n=2 Tax=Paenibacillus curdlanolyticus TaxID=59840 RepID=E0IDC4_9BACL|nr:prolipoprotein diacylglyceryl transferase [Paenibacillus curdlanolyticus YK9]